MLRRLKRLPAQASRPLMHGPTTDVHRHLQSRHKAAPKAPPAFAYGLPGGGNILGEFDPAGFLEGKSELEVYRYREAELTHGRVSMLASLVDLVSQPR